MKICLLGLIALFTANPVFSESNKDHWWIMKQAQGCLPAVGILAPENVLKQHPNCKKDINFPKGMMVLDCKNTTLRTSLAFFKSQKACENMVKSLKSQGF